VAAVADAIGLPIGNCDPASILRAARGRGPGDWGDDAFQTPMNLLCDAVRENGRLTPLARVVMRQSFIRAVKNRLELQACLQRHPDIEQTRIERPIFVLGFPRTGTTVLQNLLCLQPGRRGLRFWELVTPVPWHENPAIDERKRRANAKRMLKAAYLIAPEQKEIHFIDAETYEECWPLFGASFCVMNYDLQSGMRRYGDFLMDHDMVGPYQEYAQVLKLLSWRNPADQLVLKCPEHLWFVDALLEVFPDACIVWTHRDPVPTIASYCSLMSLQWRTLYGHYDPTELGEHITTRFHQGIQRAMAARAAADPKRFFDVNFHNLVNDQAGTVRAICEYFELPHGEHMDTAVAGWLANRRADHRGAHKYSAARYGIDTARVHDLYRDYIDQFEVQVTDA